MRSRNVATNEVQGEQWRTLVSSSRLGNLATPAISAGTGSTAARADECGSSCYAQLESSRQGAESTMILFGVEDLAQSTAGGYVIAMVDQAG